MKFYVSTFSPTTTSNEDKTCRIKYSTKKHKTRMHTKKGLNKMFQRFKTENVYRIFKIETLYTHNI